MGKNIKVICLLLLDIILIFCGCSEKKNSLQPQPTSLYACNDYTMRIRGDGTVEYLYQRDGFAEAVSYQTEEPFPAFSGYDCVGIVEGDRFEECPEVIVRDGYRVSENTETAAWWEEHVVHMQTGVSFEEVPIILEQVESWNDMVQLIGDRLSGYAALRKDGTVISTGVLMDAREQETVVEDWTDIVQIVAAPGVLYGLKKDGTICHHATGWGDILDRKLLEEKLAGWEDVVQIAGGHHLFGVRSDGTVLTTATNFYAYKQWTDIVQVAASDRAIIGLKKDGTLEAECRLDNAFTQEEVADWTDVVQIAVCDEYCIGVRSDGTVLKTGEKDDAAENN